MPATYTLPTRSTHAYALVKPTGIKATFVDGVYTPGVVTGAHIVGYAASKSKPVHARARRLGAIVVPIVDGKATLVA
jgi:hypothetical protein